MLSLYYILFWLHPYIYNIPDSKSFMLITFIIEISASKQKKSSKSQEP